MMNEIHTQDVDATALIGEADGASDEEPGPSPAGVVVLHDAWRSLNGAVSTVHQAVIAAYEAEPGLAGGDVAIALASDAEVRDLNGRFRGQDKPTNVLSFPAAALPNAPASDASGDIVIAYETVMREAAEEGKPPLHHLAHLTIHGLLHLGGYDHEDDGEAEEMEALERRILRNLGMADPYRSDSEGDQPRQAVATRE
jgi:probable rRNA maturation factor